MRLLRLFLRKPIARLTSLATKGPIVPTLTTTVGFATLCKVKTRLSLNTMRLHHSKLRGLEEEQLVDEAIALNQKLLSENAPVES